MNKKVILFGGAVGSSKTPIAIYLSWNLGIPIFSTDAIRSEVYEDTLSSERDGELYENLKSTRLKQSLGMNDSIILDASIDRKYSEIEPMLKDLGYSAFLISLNLSKDFLSKLYIAKGYEESLKRIDTLVEEHNSFLRDHSSVVSLSIDDNNFNNRLNLSLAAVSEFINS